MVGIRTGRVVWTAIQPGQPNVIGTCLGVFFVAFAVSGLSIAGAEAWVGPVFNGAALVGALPCRRSSADDVQPWWGQSSKSRAVTQVGLGIRRGG
jgi:hypothetical protein